MDDLWLDSLGGPSRWASCGWVGEWWVAVWLDMWCGCVDAWMRQCLHNSTDIRIFAVDVTDVVASVVNL